MEKSIDFLSSLQLESHGVTSPERQWHHGEYVDGAFKFHFILGGLFMIVFVIKTPIVLVTKTPVMLQKMGYSQEHETAWVVFNSPAQLGHDSQ